MPIMGRFHGESLIHLGLKAEIPKIPCLEAGSSCSNPHLAGGQNSLLDIGNVLDMRVVFISESCWAPPNSYFRSIFNHN
jgi:hypothetical protein